MFLSALAVRSTPASRSRLFSTLTAFASALVCTALLGVGWAHGEQGRKAAAGGSANGTQARAQAIRPELAFEPNVGQAEAGARYVAHGPGFDVQLRQNAASNAVKIDFLSPRKAPAGKKDDPRKVAATPAPAPWSVGLELVGASAQPQLDASQKLLQTDSYFPASDVKTWHANIPTYGRVNYSEVYPGIGLSFYGRDSRLEYDFTLAPRADAQAIRLHLTGMASAALDSKGDLVLKGKSADAHGDKQQRTATFLKPVAYQLAADGKTRDSVAVTYRLGQAARGGTKSGTKAGADVTFDIASYDHARPLVIDPVLAYGEYLPLGTGSAYYEAGVKTDSAGNAYVLTGYSSYSGFAVVKLDPGGTVLKYIAVGDGSAYAVPQALAIDASGNAYVTGYVYGNLPTTSGAYQPAKNGAGGSYDAFLSVLKADGSGLSYSTYFGGSGDDYGQAIAADASGNAYITGSTTSTDLPTTAGVYQAADPKTNTASVGLVAKFDPSASGAASLVYSTYLGGTGTSGDYLYGIVLDSSSNPVVTGDVYSINYPITDGSFQYAGASGGPYAVVTKLKADASALIYSANLGPGDGYSLALDGSGAVYVAGLAGADDFPTTTGAYQVTYPGAFAAKLSADGTTLVYSTFLGGPSSANNNTAAATSIALPPGCASNCAASIAGYTTSVDFPLVNAIQSTPRSGGGAEGFITQLNAAGTAATFSSYISGVLSYEYNSVASLRFALDASGNLLVALSDATGSYDFPTTLPNPSSVSSTYLAKISPAAGSLALVTPSALNVGGSYVGVPYTTTSDVVTLRNVGSSAISSLSIAIDDPEFSETDNCGTSLAAAGQCSINLTITPNGTGNRSGNLTVTSSAPNSPATVTLTGYASDQAYLQLSTASLSFADQALNTTSAGQTFTITNVGSEPATFFSPAYVSSNIAGEFSVATNCPGTLAIGASCTGSISFSPLQAGAQTGTLEIPGSAFSALSVTGTGIASTGSGILALTADAVNFGTSPVGVAASGQYLYAYNSSSVPVTVSAYTLKAAGATDYTADFSISSSNCGPSNSVDPGSPCYVYVNFTPSVAGTEVVTLNIANSTSTNPISVTLTGTGTADTQVLEFSPTNQVFAAQPVGVSSAPQYFYLTNTGTVPFAIDRIVASGDFQVQQNSCVGTLQPTNQDYYQSCSLYVTFTPTATGNRTGTITVYDPAGTNPQVLNLVGTGIAATGSLSLQNSSLTFGQQAVGTTSAYQSLFLTNTGNSPVQANTATVTGDFALSYNGCNNVVVQPGSYCEEDVTYTPMKTGAETGTVVFGTAAGNFKAALSGTGVTATQAIGFTPTAVNFGNVQEGISTATLPGNYAYVFVRNTGTEAVTLSAAPQVSANFSIISNGCGGANSQIAPGASCQLYLSFTAPASAGAVTGTLTLTDDAGTHSIPLTGNATAAQPNYYLAPTELAYNQQPVGTNSGTGSGYTYFVNNTANAVSFTSVTVTGDFTIPTGYNSCLSSGVSANSECLVYVNFAPTAVGYRTGTLTLKDASNNTYTVPLAGYAPAETNGIALSKNNLVFDDEVAGGTSTTTTLDQAQYVYLTNTSNEPLTVGSLTGFVSGDFTVSTDQCSGTTIQAGSACYVYVAFTPATVGAKTGSITFPVTFADNTTASLKLALAGKGVAADQHGTLTPTKQSFIDQTVGVNYPTAGANAPQSFTFTNDGNITLSVGTVSLSNTTDFSDTATYANDGCSGRTLAPSQTCTVSVLFQPGSAGAKSGIFTLPVTYAGTSATATFSASLTGKGIAPNTMAVLNPTAAQAEVEVVNTQDIERTLSFTATNTSNQPIVLGTVTVDAPFSLYSDGCSGRTLNPTYTCTETVIFAPTSSTPASYKATNYSGTLSIPVTGGATLKATVTGTGIPVSQQVVLSQPTINFGSVNVSSSSPQLSAEVVNQGPYYTGSGYGAVTITGISLGGTNASDFSLNPGISVGNALQGRSTFPLYVTFSPAAASTGTRTATVTVTYTGTAPNPSGTLVLTLTGKGTNPVPQATVFPATLAFGTQPVGVTSTAQSFSVTNTGSANLVLGTLTFSNGTVFPVQSNGCSGQTLTPSQSCQVSIAFDPSAGGAVSGSVTIPSNAATQTVSLSGTGSGGPQLSITPGSLTFANQAVNSTSAAQNLVLKNSGGGTLTFSQIFVASGNFAETNNCSAGLTGAATCTVAVTFDPQSVGAQTGSLSITDNATGSPQSVKLSGTGTQQSQTITFPALPSTTYGAAPITLGATASSGLPVSYSVTGPASVSGSALTITGAGSVTVTASQAGNANYAAATPVSHTLTVTQAVLTVTANNASRAYGAANPAFSYAITGFVNGDPSSVVAGTATLTSEANATSAPGTYPITFATEALTASNYAFTYVPGTLTVTAGVASAPSLSTGTGSYTAAQSVTITDSTPNAVIYYTLDGSAPTTSSSQYTTPLQISSNLTLKTAAIGTGYTLSSVTSATYTFIPATVSPATLTFAAQNDETTSTAKTLTVSNPGANALTGFSASITGADPADFAIVPNGACSGTVAAGGSCSYSITFTPQAKGSRAAKIAISYSGTGSPISAGLTGTGVAVSPTIMLTASPASISYGQSVSVTASLSGTPAPTGTLSYTLDGGTAQSATLAGGLANINLGVLSAGSHTLATSYAGDSVYGTASQSLTLTVAKAVLTATAASVSKAPGTANPTLTYAVTGFVNGDTSAVVSGTATLTTTATTNSAPGTYPISFSTEALSAANYSFTYVGGTLTVTSLTQQTITFGPLAGKTYGSAPVALTATASSGLPVSYTVTGPATVSGSTLTITGAGTVSVTASQAGDASYAPATSVTQSFTVAKAVLTATAASVSKAPGTANPTLTYAVTGFVNGDTSAAVSGTATLTTTATTNSAPGTYPISFSTEALSAVNYSFTYLGGTLTVTSLTQQTITFGPLAGKTYGSAPVTLTATASSGLPVSYTVTGPASVSGSVLTITGAGTVSVTASQAGNASYAPATSVTQSFTVAKAVLTATAASVSKAPGTANPALTYAVTGFVNGDTSAVVSGTATLTTTATTNSAPGTYPISFSTEALSAANYSFTYVGGTLTVTSLAAPAPPSFNPPGGSYAAAQTVTIADATAAVSIFYTTDGSTPSASSTPYSAPIVVAHTETVKAIAILNGVASTVSSAVYTITGGQCTLINYKSGFTSTGLQLNGGASIVDGALSLTDQNVSEARSAFFTTKVPVSSFVTDFTFQLLHASADGFTFTIQKDGPGALGGNGGGLGYAGIANSVALKFDLHNNQGEGVNSVGVFVNGAFPGQPSTDLTPSGIDLHSGHIFAAEVTSTSTSASLTLTDTVTHAKFSMSIPAGVQAVLGNGPAYAGFTGGTGAKTATQNILSWTYQSPDGCSQQ